MSTLSGRKAWLLNHPEIGLIPPDIFSVNVSGAIIEVNISNATIVDLMLTISPFNSKFRAYPMNDAGTNGDLVAGDGIWSTIQPNVPLGTSVKFYVRAQNNDAMRLSPERAEYEFYEYDTTVGTLQYPGVSLNTELISVTDNLGRSVGTGASGMLLYHYSDGQVRKVLRMLPH